MLKNFISGMVSGTVIALSHGCAVVTDRLPAHDSGPVVAVPSPVEARFRSALDALKAGDMDQAASLLEELSLENPAYVSPLINLGLIYVEAGEDAWAKDVFEWVVRQDPGNCTALNQLALLQRKRHDFVGDESSHLACLSNEPAHAETLLNLGVLYELYMGRLAEARAFYETYHAVTADERVTTWIADLTRRIESEQLAVNGIGQ